MLPISVFIITKNEADRLQSCIDSVKAIAAEIIVIDSGSTDNTKEIALNNGAKFIVNEWPGYGLQKRFGEDSCENNWVLNLDADERLSAELQKEIIGEFNNEKPAVAGFKMAIVDVYPHQDKPLKNAPRYNKVRLYNKAMIRYSPHPVHDTVQVEGQEIKNLAGIVIHKSIRSLSHLTDKTNRYTDEQVKALVVKNTCCLSVKVITTFPLSFLKAYFLRGHWRGGMYGFMLAMNYAYGRYLRVAKGFEKWKI
jgi:glycosyltransferase involved in cell wall biosynthesis